MPDGHDADSIFCDLRERISLLDHPPGSLLSENRLAAHYGVTRTPIRRALQRLEYEGLVTVARGIGTVVTPIDMVYLTQVYAFRLKLIDLIGELSSSHVAPADLALLEEQRRAVRSLPVPISSRRLAEAYLRFHEELTRAVGNRPLREVSDRYFHQTSRVWVQLLPELDRDEERASAAAEIDEVLAALRDRDMIRVAQVRRRYFERCLRRMNDRIVGADLEFAATRSEGGDDAPHDRRSTRQRERTK
ncbi:MAG: GntR family transcriptional regulator [Trueperaceae bacterium]